MQDGMMVAIWLVMVDIETQNGGGVVMEGQ